MKHFAKSLILATGLCGITAAHGAEVLKDARSNLEQWVQTRRIISEESSQWEAQQKSLNSSIKLLQNEIQALNEQISKATSDIGAADNAQVTLKSDIKTSKAALAVIEKALPSFEARLLKLSTIFPDVFKEKVATQLRRIPDPKSASKMDLSTTDRVQNIISLLQNIEYFNNVVTPASELQTLENGEIIEVKTLYLGLAQAYYVDPNREIAGFGYPVIGEGWKWTEKNEIAENIGNLVEVSDNRRPAEFIEVPVEIK